MSERSIFGWLFEDKVNGSALGNDLNAYIRPRAPPFDKKFIH